MDSQPETLLLVLLIFGVGLLVAGLSHALLARSRGLGARFLSAAAGVVGLAVSLAFVRTVVATDPVPASADMALLEQIHTVPDLEEDESVWGWTDRRSPLRLFRASAPRPADDLCQLEFEVLAAQRRQGHVIRRAAADDRGNCFGWIFAEGRYWLDANQIEFILGENGYRPVAVPVAGDLAVYRDDEGHIHHAAVVRAVCDDGTILVEGKWGWMGVYMHRLYDSLYGKNVSLLHSERLGHGLRLSPAAESSR